MSNLNNNTTQLELLLAKVNALPEAGGSSGSVETCTVTITNEATGFTRMAMLCYSVFENGVISYITGSVQAGKTITIQNVVRNTIIVLKYTQTNVSMGTVATSNATSEIKVAQAAIIQVGTDRAGAVSITVNVA